jgi:fatty acid desaturase
VIRDLKSCCLQLKALENDLKAKYPFLFNPNWISLSFLCAAFFLFAVSSYFYFQHSIPWYVCLILNAFAFSILHEIEHDVIHNLYFQGNKLIQGFIFSLCWLARPNMINPWLRKKIHLIHHQRSGTEDDVEELLIGNGMPYKIPRFLIALDQAFCLLRFRQLKTPYFEPLKIVFFSCIPMGVYTFTWLLCAYLYISPLLGFSVPEALTSYSAALYFLLVIWVLPNTLRSFCLIFLSTSNHYHGNVDNEFEQTQVLNKWYFLPLQFFCFNFGATHAIHHLYTPQPFYIRHLIRKKAYAILRENGVHFNDLGTFFRKNRYES